MTKVFVAFDLRGGSASDHEAFLSALKKRKWRVAKGPALTVSAKFKPTADKTRIKTVLQEDFDAAAREIGKDYSATAVIGEHGWDFSGLLSASHAAG